MPPTRAPSTASLRNITEQKREGAAGKATARRLSFLELRLWDPLPGPLSATPFSETPASWPFGRPRRNVDQFPKQRSKGLKAPAAWAGVPLTCNQQTPSQIRVSGSSRFSSPGVIFVEYVKTSLSLPSPARMLILEILEKAW